MKTEGTLKKASAHTEEISQACDALCADAFLNYFPISFVAFHVGKSSRHTSVCASQSR